MRRIYDLRSNNVDIESLGAIAEDVAKLHIFGLQLGIRKFTLSMKPRFRMGKSDETDMDVYYSIRQYDEMSHEIIGAMNLRFFTKRFTCDVKMEAVASARFNYEPYVEKLKIYLYTFMARTVEHNDVLLLLKLLKLPDTIVTLHPVEPTIFMVREEAFTWRDIFESKGSLSRIPMTEAATSECLWAASYGIVEEEKRPKDDLDNEEFLRHMADIQQRELRAKGG